MSVHQEEGLGNGLSKRRKRSPGLLQLCPMWDERRRRVWGLGGTVAWRLPWAQSRAGEEQMPGVVAALCLVGGPGGAWRIWLVREAVRSSICWAPSTLERLCARGGDGAMLKAGPIGGLRLSWRGYFVLSLKLTGLPWYGGFLNPSYFTKEHFFVFFPLMPSSQMRALLNPTSSSHSLPLILGDLSHSDGSDPSGLWSLEPRAITFRIQLLCKPCNWTSRVGLRRASPPGTPALCGPLSRASPGPWFSFDQRGAAELMLCGSSVRLYDVLLPLYGSTWTIPPGEARRVKLLVISRPPRLAEPGTAVGRSCVERGLQPPLTRFSSWPGGNTWVKQALGHGTRYLQTALASSANC